MRNYFKAAGEFVFFDDSFVTQTQAAFDRAKAFGRVAVYQLPPNPGEWDRSGIVGHRLRGQILADMDRAKGEEFEVLASELERLDREYFAAGRDHLPLMAVAA